MTDSPHGSHRHPPQAVRRRSDIRARRDSVRVSPTRPGRNAHRAGQDLASRQPRPDQADPRRRPRRRVRRRGAGGRHGGGPAARLALRHPQLRSRRAAARARRVSRDRALPARLRLHALPVRRHPPQRAAVGDGGRRDRADGRARHRLCDRRRVRLGRAHRQYHGDALAGALQGDGFRVRLPDRQQRGNDDPASAGGRAPVVVSVLLRHRARPRRLHHDTPTISPS